MRKRVKRIIALVVTFIFLVNWSSNLPASSFSQEEQQLGRIFDAMVSEQFVILEDEELGERIKEIGMKLVKASDRKDLEFTFKIVNDPLPNAFSGPGGYVYITTGLLDILRSKDELAAVLAHEIAYVSSEDQVRFFKSEKTKERLRTIGGFILGLVSQSVGNIGAQALSGQLAMSAGKVIALELASVVGQSISQALLEAGSSSLVVDETDLSNRIAALHRQRQKAYQEGRIEDYKRIDEELKKLEQANEEIIRLMRGNYPEYAAIKYPQPVEVSQIILNPSEVLIKYEVTEKNTLAWLVRNGKIVKTVEVPIEREELHKMVREYLSCFRGVENYSQLGNFNPIIGKRLYDLLMKDILNPVSPKEEKIIIAPDDILEVLPFEALVMELPPGVKMLSGVYGPYPQGVKYIGDEYSISYYHSATSLSVIRKLKKWEKTEKPLLVLADPIFSAADARAKVAKAEEVESEYQLSLRRVVKEEEWKHLEEYFSQLPLTSQLANRLKQLFPKAELLLELQASESELRKKSLKDYQYLVFATHGILDKEVPYLEEPALVLSQVMVDPEDRDNDGFLTMTEVMKLKLSCDVVALTACNTGLGRQISGEGVMGMGRAFQYAGARAVLMSLWSVEDESTNLLTEKFFTYLKQGKDKLEALRQARSDLRKAGYQHPFFWAPFILVGER